MDSRDLNKQNVQTMKHSLDVQGKGGGGGISHKIKDRDLKGEEKNLRFYSLQYVVKRKRQTERSASYCRRSKEVQHHLQSQRKIFLLINGQNIHGVKTGKLTTVKQTKVQNRLRRDFYPIMSAEILHHKSKRNPHMGFHSNDPVYYQDKN